MLLPVLAFKSLLSKCDTKRLTPAKVSLTECSRSDTMQMLASLNGEYYRSVTRVAILIPLLGDDSE